MSDLVQNNLRSFAAHRLGIEEDTITDSWAMAVTEEMDSRGQMRPVEVLVFCSYLVGTREERKVSKFKIKYQEFVASLVAFESARAGKER